MELYIILWAYGAPSWTTALWACKYTLLGPQVWNNEPSLSCINSHWSSGLWAPPTSGHLRSCVSHGLPHCWPNLHCVQLSLCKTATCLFLTCFPRPPGLCWLSLSPFYCCEYSFLRVIYWSICSWDDYNFVFFNNLGMAFGHIVFSKNWKYLDQGPCRLLERLHPLER